MLFTHSITTLEILYLGLAGLIAGTIDTLAGGGGLIALPAILLIGIPPAVALGTNKLQSIVGELNASIHFLHHGKIKIQSILLGIIFSGTGAILGAIIVRHIHPTLLNKFIPFLTLSILIYVSFANKFIQPAQSPRLSKNLFFLIFGLLIGFYNGFFGPGTGSFWVVALMYFLSFDLKQATLHGKPLNLSGNIASVIYFIAVGLINYQCVAVMAVGQIIGSLIGARLVMKQGAKIIKPIFIVSVSIMTIMLFIKNY